MNPAGDATLSLRKDLESWLRGKTALEAESTEETLAEAENILGAPGKIQAEITEEEEMEEVETAAEQIPAKDFPEYSPEAGDPAPVLEGELYAHEKHDDDNENERPEGELLEEADSRLTTRLRHINDMRQASTMHQRGGFRKSRMRFFTLCVLAVIVIGTAAALYRNAQRNSYDAMIEKASGLYGQEQYAAAFDAYNETSRRYPDRVEPLLGTAHAAERMGRVEDAIAAYRSSLERFPPDAMHTKSNVFYEVGRLYATLKAWDKAQENFEEAIATDAANYGAYFFLGDAMEEQGQPDKALSAYKRALELSPSSDAAMEAVRRVTLILSSEEEKDSAAAQVHESALLSGDVAIEEKPVEINEPQNKKDVRPRRNNTRSSSPRSKRNAPSSTKNSPVSAMPREKLFDAGVELYLKGDYAASYHKFAACLHSKERGILPVASLAGGSGPIWKGSQARLNVPSDAGLLADAVRMNPVDRGLYVNLLMAGTKMGMDRKALRATLKETRSHALLRSSNL